MTLVLKVPLIIIAVYLWIGFVIAISFMEAWLKFRAPGVTIPIGLGIGRLVFNALNKIEWIFTIAIFAGLLISKQVWPSDYNLLFYIPVLLLAIQTVWLLPALDRRAEMHINGLETPRSYLHLYYVLMEIIKVACLFIFGIKQYLPYIIK